MRVDSVKLRSLLFQDAACAITSRVVDSASRMGLPGSYGYFTRAAILLGMVLEYFFVFLLVLCSPLET